MKTILLLILLMPLAALAADNKPEFTREYLEKNFPVPEQVRNNRAVAEKVFSEIESSGHYTNAISPDDLLNLPIGVKWGPVTIGIQKVKLYPLYSELTIFMKLDFNGQTLFLGMDDVRLSKTGGFYGDCKVVLLGDYHLVRDGGGWMITLKGSMDMHSGAVTTKTYATFDCAQFKELSIAGEVSFPRSVLLPLDNKYEIITDPKKKVAGSFHTVVNDPRDVIVETSFSNAFVVTSAEKLVYFKVQNAILDLSVTENSPLVKFPENYNEANAQNPEIWRGVYIEKAEVILPPEFKTANNAPLSDPPPGFQASDIIIDGTGLTFKGEINTRLAVPVPGGWELSVTRWHLNMLRFQVLEAGFSGYIKIPVGKDTLAYEAVYDAATGSFRTRVQNQTKLDFSLFMAKAELDPNSYVEITVKNKKFHIKAVLNGKMGIDVYESAGPADAIGKPITSIEGLTFQNLAIQSTAPYIQADFFGYRSKVQLGGFPIVLREIGLIGKGNELGIGFALDANLLEGKLTAETKMAIISKFDEQAPIPVWVYDRLELGKFAVEADFAGVLSFKGSLTYNRNHPVMGTGLEGTLGAKLKLWDKPISIDIKGGSGNKEQPGGEIVRYIYFDALAAGFNIPVNGMNITSIGFGIGKHVTRAADLLVDTSVSPMGMGYIPSATTGMSFRGMLGFNLGASELTTAETSIDIQFTPSGGLQSVGFYGKAYIMPPPNFVKALQDVQAVKQQIVEKVKATEQKIAANSAVFNALSKLGNLGKMNELVGPSQNESGGDGPKALMTALVAMTYDHGNRVFHANLDIYANIPGGMVTGAGANGKAGWGEVDVNFANGKFHAYFGTPDNPVGLKANMALLGNEANASIKSYYMAGNVLPASPPLNPLISQKFPGINLNENRDLGAACSGKGIVFGTELNGSINVSLPIVYYNFNVLAGFEMTFKNYGDLYCNNTQSQIGFNGWQGRGDLYAYLQGEMGVRINVFNIVRKEVSLLRGSAACILQGQFPNPTFARGGLSLEISSPALSALSKMNVSVSSGPMIITVGERCDAAGSTGPESFSENVIASITPAHLDKEVDVFAVPQVVFNKKVGQSFDIDNGGTVKTYRFGLQSFRLLNSDGTPVAGKEVLNPRGSDAIFQCNEILPPGTRLKAIAEVTFEEWRDGEWQAVYDSGRKVTEIREAEFTTGLAPLVIPMQNITYSYPVVDQKYFYTREHLSAGLTQGYIQLNRGQSYLFGDTAQALRAEFVSANGDSTRLAFRYDSVARKIWFDLPVLNNSSSYTFKLIRLPEQTGTENIVEQKKTVETALGRMEITENRAEGALSQNIVHEFLSFGFASSRFNTFREKMQQKILKKGHYEIITADVGHLQADVFGLESFDRPELSGTHYTGSMAMIQARAVMTDLYYQRDIEPLIYHDYPLSSDVTIDRDTAQQGLIPVRAVRSMVWFENMLDGNSSNRLLQERLPHRYELTATYNRDFRDLQYKAVNKYINNPHNFPAALRKYLNASFPAMGMGFYPVQFLYRLPGGETGSGFSFDYKNSLN